MATIALGPNGVAIEGNDTCANRDFLLGQAGPYGNLVNILMDQRLIGMKEWMYDDWGLEVDRHMPMRPNSVRNGNITETRHFKYDLAYDGIMNMDLGRNILPEFADYDIDQKYRDSCGLNTLSSLSSSGNVNAEACNPGLDGPMPTSGVEWYGRTATGVRMPLPPLCTTSFPNKEGFSMVVAAALRAAKNAAATAFRVLQHRWIISQSRYNASPLYTSLGNGQIQLIDSPDLFTANKFGHVPTHWGSAAWFASMIQYSEIPDAPNITVSLPPAILEKFKQDYMRSIGFNLWSEAQNITRDVNGYIVQALEESLRYTHPTTGQKITFVASSNPIYVEVKELGPEKGTWSYQEKWVKRDSEQEGQIFRRRNPNWGRQCACPGSILAAIVTVTADGGGKPFYKEPLPNNNPPADIKNIFAQYAGRNGIQLNSSLADFYPSTETTTILTGLEAQAYILDPANAKARAAGSACDVASNLKNAWVGGFTEIFSQFVAVAPREIAHFLLRMPKMDMCSVAPVFCDEPSIVPAAGEIDPQINPFYKNPELVPDPVPAPTPAAGEVYMLGKITRVTADCTADKAVSFVLQRFGGTYGAITITIAGTPSTHGGTPPTTVTFADGDEFKTVTWDIDDWNNTDPDTANETFNLTLTGLAADGYNVRQICIKPPLCTSACDDDTTGCTSCGTV